MKVGDNMCAGQKNFPCHAYFAVEKSDSCFIVIFSHIVGKFTLLLQ